MSRTLRCADCGGHMRRSVTSLPEGQARCHGCRRETAGRARDERATNKPKPKPLPSGTVRGVCAECQGPVVVGSRRRKFCSEVCMRRAGYRRGSGGKSPAPLRGYDAEHRRLRRELLPAAYGTPCALCGDVMLDGDQLHLDHTDDRQGYRGFSHAACNVLDGARRGGQRSRDRRLAEGRRVPSRAVSS